MTTRRWMSAAALMLAAAFVATYTVDTELTEVAAVTLTAAPAPETPASCADGALVEPECAEGDARPGTATCNNCPSDAYCINYCCASGVGRCTITHKCMCML